MEVIAKVCLIVSLSGGVSMSGLWTPDPEFAEVISLISTNIEAARCRSKCAGLPAENMQQCNDMCRNSADLCSYSWRCPDAACRQGCSDSATAGGLAIGWLHQTGCTVTWRLIGAASTTTIVLGEDQAGMWRVLDNAGQPDRVDLEVAETVTFARLAVVAVSGAGVEDIKTLDILPTVSCQHEVNHRAEARVQPAAVNPAADFNHQDATDDDVTSTETESPAAAIDPSLFFGLAVCCFVLSVTALVLYCLHNCRSKPADSPVLSTKLSAILKENKPSNIVEEQTKAARVLAETV